ncbi:glycolate utilization operon transcriptional activator GlcC [Burkholderia cenocepacia]|nr:glycolate utilization operon transcriptional activator GlcC [Burkholderia cenocepacia]
MRKIETALLDGTWPAGARLPAERVLAQQYGVARNTVREATQRLVARGLLQSRRGAGVYATDQLRAGIASPWGQLVADHPALRDDILEFRRVLEGATAYFAALRADANDRRRIRALLRELETAHANDDAAVEAATDAKLHEAIALASHNTMFLHLHTSVIGMLREHISINVAGMTMEDEQASELLLLQHRGRVRGDLRAAARRGAHRDADAYRLRAQPFRTQRRYVVRLVGPVTAAARAAAGRASRATLPGARCGCAARAIDRFVGRLLESTGTACQPRAAAMTCPLIRLSRKLPCSRP